MSLRQSRATPLIQVLNDSISYQFGIKCLPKLLLILLFNTINLIHQIKLIIKHNLINRVSVFRCSLHCKQNTNLITINFVTK